MASERKKRLFAHVLLYHAVSENLPVQPGMKLHNVCPDVLFKQLSWVKQNFDVVDLDSLARLQDREGKCAITFDDAYKSVFTNALPILADLNLPASVFVIGSTLTGKIFWRDKMRMLIGSGLSAEFVAWAEAFCRSNRIDADNLYKKSKCPSVNSAELDKLLSAFLDARVVSGRGERNLCADDERQLVEHPLLSYGNHTENHYVLASLSGAEQRREIRRNAALLETLGRKTTQVFSVPFGGLETFDTETCTILAREGYSAFLLSRSRVNHVTDGPLPKLNGLPVLERYMPVGSFSGFQRQIAELIDGAGQRVGLGP
ncbi:polysaccharide deacetylase family protein [Roseibium aggregatum]|uniref:Chitooligosaccharide deacetylase n=1 Tax=Roseibium aggregatum TaxID=187304 RepID=A0A939EDH6_9HYPH|nr:polysaccharide deacetylase family protein [Roseibium aggregatum]MBN9670567.1 polysaccharide deacetylase family protein [Roseibium aggregatum]